jgi:hypothetical protein
MEFTQIHFAVMIINNKEVLHRHRLRPSLTIITINEMFVVIDNNHHRIPIKDRTLMVKHLSFDYSIHFLSLSLGSTSKYGSNPKVNI